MVKALARRDVHHGHTSVQRRDPEAVIAVGQEFPDILVGQQSRLTRVIVVVGEASPVPAVHSAEEVADPKAALIIQFHTDDDVARRTIRVRGVVAVGGILVALPVVEEEAVAVRANPDVALGSFDEAVHVHLGRIVPVLDGAELKDALVVIADASLVGAHPDNARVIDIEALDCILRQAVRVAAVVMQGERAFEVFAQDIEAAVVHGYPDLPLLVFRYTGNDIAGQAVGRVFRLRVVVDPAVVAQARGSFAQEAIDPEVGRGIREEARLPVIRGRGRIEKGGVARDNLLRLCIHALQQTIHIQEPIAVRPLTYRHHTAPGQIILPSEGKYA